MSIKPNLITALAGPEDSINLSGAVQERNLYNALEFNFSYFAQALKLNIFHFQKSKDN